LAFLIPIIERLLKLEEPTKRHHVAAIIISPTRLVWRKDTHRHELTRSRELATQIYGVLQSLLAFQTHRDHDNVEDQHKDISRILPQLLVGGAASPAQDLSNFLKDSPNVLVSTPGRLLELLSSPHVKCPQSSFEVLVLDEADRLLDLGFKDDLQKILTRLPKQRRTSLFSASVSEAVDQIVRVGLRNPVKVAVKVKGAAGKEDQRTPAR
jgi:ATP-dependent RNA helicase DDX55/SPB4